MYSRQEKTCLDLTFYFCLALLVLVLQINNLLFFIFRNETNCIYLHMATMFIQIYMRVCAHFSQSAFGHIKYKTENRRRRNSLFGDTTSNIYIRKTSHNAYTYLSRVLTYEIRFSSLHRLCAVVRSILQFLFLAHRYFLLLIFACSIEFLAMP